MLNTPNGSLTSMELRVLVQRLQAEMPALGQTMVWRRLRSMGFFVTSERVRSVIHDIDPIQTALRWRCDLVRHQPYSVPGPNSLWHLALFVCSHITFSTHMHTCTHNTLTHS